MLRDDVCSLDEVLASVFRVRIVQLAELSKTKISFPLARHASAFSLSAPKFAHQFPLFFSFLDHGFKAKQIRVLPDSVSHTQQTAKMAEGGVVGSTQALSCW
ncbi:MAG: hypothetical protein ACPGLY_27385 [Rubripirellula sp.]